MPVLKIQMSITDSEPMGELVEIICGWDRDKLPVEYKDQLEGWAHKFLAEGDDEADSKGQDTASPSLVEQENS